MAEARCCAGDWSHSALTGGWGNASGSASSFRRSAHYSNEMSRCSRWPGDRGAGSVKRTPQTSGPYALCHPFPPLAMPLVVCIINSPEKYLSCKMNSVLLTADFKSPFSAKNVFFLQFRAFLWFFESMSEQLSLGKALMLECQLRMQLASSSLLDK